MRIYQNLAYFSNLFLARVALLNVLSGYLGFFIIIVAGFALLKVLSGSMMLLKSAYKLSKKIQSCSKEFGNKFGLPFLDKMTSAR